MLLPNLTIFDHMMATETASPPSSLSSSRRSTPLSLDLSNLPPLIEPSPPSNTLLITNLNDVEIFSPSNLASLRQNITTLSPPFSFSPLKSLRRVIATFHSTDAAIAVRDVLDGAMILTSRARVYYGEEVPIEPQDQHLHLPDTGKLFFISPPPSPPHGWESKQEGAPNKEVIAEDLVGALERLGGAGKRRDEAWSRGPMEGVEGSGSGSEAEEEHGRGRRRGRSSTLVYHPEDHGDSPLLPSVLVEDTTMGDDGEERAERAIMAHTARPPVELME